MNRLDSDLRAADLPRRTRTWYGAPAHLRAEPGGLCEAGLWGLALPHPLVVNLFIRRGLPADARLRLSYWHELGHLQALPMVASAALLTSRSRTRRGWRHCVLAVLGLNGLWKLLAETYVVLKTRQDYLRIYRETSNPFPIPFWIGMTILSLATLSYRVSPVEQTKE